MTSVVELLGPPAAGKTMLAAALARGGMPVVAEQLRELLLSPDPPPPGPARQLAVAERIAGEAGDIPHMDLAELLVHLATAWSSPRAPDDVVGPAEGERRDRGQVAGSDQ